MKDFTQLPALLRRAGLLMCWLLPALLSAQTPRINRIVPSGTVNVLLRSGDTTFVGGSFSEAGYYSSRLALTQAGSAVPIDRFPMANSTIEEVISDDAGGWYVAGGFSQIGGQNIRYLAHILPDFSVDLNFNPNPNSTVRALVKTASHLYAGGAFTQIGGFANSYVAQLDPATGQATAWNPEPNGQVYSLAYRAPGSMYIGGSFTRIAGRAQRNFAELDLAGDSLLVSPSVNSTVHDVEYIGDDIYLGGSFSEAGHAANYAAISLPGSDFPSNRFPNFNSTVNAVIEDGAGGWYIGGSFSQVDGASVARLVHILPDLTVDANFNPNPNSTVETLVLDQNFLYVGGSFTQIAGQAQGYAARLDLSNNAALSAWNPQVGSTVYAILPSGSDVYIGGSFSTVAGKRQRYFARVSAADGALTPSVSTNSTVYTLSAGGSSGLILAGGSFSELGYYTPYGARFNGGSEIPTQDFPAINGSIETAIPDGAGGWYLAGSFSTIDGQSVGQRLAHILANNTLDAAFSPSPNATVYVLLKSGNTLYVGGSFTQIGGQSVSRVAAIDATTGQLLPDWTSNPAAPNSTVYALLLDGSDLYVGGSFTQLGGQPRNYLGAVDAATGALRTFNPAPNSTVYAMQKIGTALYIGGSFSQIASQNRNYLAALATDGSLVAAFNPNCNSTVYTLEAAPSGTTIYAGGSFTSIGGQPRNYLAELNLNNGTATLWNPNANSTVYSIRNGYIGGNFTTMGGQPRRYAALLQSNGSLASWNPELSSTVNIVIASGSDVLIGGSFTYAKYDQRNYMAGFNPQDNLTSDAWTLTANSTVYRIKRRDNTYFYAAGSFSQIGGLNRNYLAEFTVNGQGTVTAWNPNAGSTVYDVAIAGDTVYAAGGFTTLGNQSRRYLGALLNTNHSTHTILPWNPQASSTGNTIATAGGRVLAGGSFTYYKYETRSYLLSFSGSSKLVFSWNPAANSTVYSLHADQSRLYVGGIFSQIQGQPRAGLVRYRTGAGAADTLDVAWNAGFPGNSSIYVYDIAIIGDTVYAGGQFDVTLSGQRRKNGAAFARSNAALLSWSPQTESAINALAVRNDTLLLGGSFGYLKHEPVTNLFAIDERSGLIISGWRPNPNSTVHTLVKAGSSLYVGGSFTQLGGQPRNYLGRVNLTNGNADTWNPNLNNSVYALAWSGTDLYAGGAFTTAKSLTRNYLAAFTPASDVPAAWDPGATGSVETLAWADGKVFVGGSFTQLGGQTRNRLGSVQADGAVTSWNPNLNSTVNAIAVSEFRIYVGGGFSTLDGGTVNRRYAAAYERSTGGLTTWDPSPNSTVSALSARDNLVFMGGSFTQAGGQTAGYGALVTAGSGQFVGDLKAASTIRALFDADSLLYAGGSFTAVDDNLRTRYSALYEVSSLTVGIDPGEVQWAGLRLYPNPSRGQVYLDGEAEAGHGVECELLSLDGRVLHRETLSLLPAPLNLPALPGGIYLLRIQSGSRYAVRTLQVQP
ncbi:MAG: T9SS type A sorting domain-containing protein [Bacteroidia bacterium]|nr:T9SS type A sorting domain-containing protein [Bacteroidia bacterium]